jgi:hypothetical protein
MIRHSNAAMQHDILAFAGGFLTVKGWKPVAGNVAQTQHSH